MWHHPCKNQSHQHHTDLATHRRNLTNKKRRSQYWEAASSWKRGGGYIYTFLNLWCTHMIKSVHGVEWQCQSTERQHWGGSCHHHSLNVSPFILGVRHRLPGCVQVGSQCVENLCEVANLHFRNGRTPTVFFLESAPLLQVGNPLI